MSSRQPAGGGALAAALRCLGCLDLLALGAVFLPVETLDGVCRWLGLGSFPEGPLAPYLVRTTSCLYALYGALIVFVSCDVDRYRPLIRFLAYSAIVHGAVIVGIDWVLELPRWWRWLEGPAFAATGVLVLLLLRGADGQRRDDDGGPAPEPQQSVEKRGLAPP